MFLDLLASSSYSNNVMIMSKTFIDDAFIKIQAAVFYFSCPSFSCPCRYYKPLNWAKLHYGKSIVEYEL